MTDDPKTPDRLQELPEETRRFLAQLRESDLEALKDGLGLVSSIQTVGKFMKWVVVGVVGTFVGFVMVWENVLKLLRFLAPPEIPK